MDNNLIMVVKSALLFSLTVMELTIEEFTDFLNVEATDDDLYESYLYWKSIDIVKSNLIYSKIQSQLHPKRVTDLFV